MNNKTKIDMEKIPRYLLVFLRIAIGWHFLYEGITKVFMESWSAAPYLSGSRWIFAPVFHWMANSPTLISIVDFMNIWGMILIGLGLMIGFLARWASAAGALLLMFYFLAYPPIPGFTVGVPVEGSYLWINKTFIEFIVLLVFIFISPGYMLGIDRLYLHWKEEKARQPVPDEPRNSENVSDRREAIKNLIGIPAVGAFAYAVYKKKKWDSFEEKLLKVEGVDANSGATLLKFNYASLNDLKGTVPKGAIPYTDINGKPALFDLSRLVMCARPDLRLQTCKDLPHRR